MKRSSSTLLLAAGIASGLAATGAEAPAHASPLATQAQSAQDIRLTGAVSFHENDADGDRLYEALIAEVEVEVLTAGAYSFIGVLEKNGKKIAFMPSFESAMFSRATLEEEPGIYPVRLAFSGEEIYRSGEDGPYNLVLHAIAGASNGSLTTPTPRYDHTRFGELGAALTGVSEEAVDEDGDGEYDFVEATVEVAVRRAGDYWLQGVLSEGGTGTSIVDKGDGFSLSRGTHSVNLRFPGLPLRRHATDGPYSGSVNISDATGHTVGSIQFVTKEYRAVAFAPLMELDGRFRDTAIDGDEDDEIDVLRLELGISVREAGEFLLVGILKNPDAPHVVFADTITTLTRSPEIVTLDFLGTHIHYQGISGPYELELVLRDPESYDELDRSRAQSLTAAYDFTDFESRVPRRR